jgi:YHS domain-containing protein
MKRAIMLSLAILSAAVFVEASDQPAKVEKKTQFYCPVAGMPEAKSCCCPGGYCPRMPSPSYTIEYKGSKIQLCCGLCSKVFKETPAKFAAVANHQLVATGQAAQVHCPTCGEDLVTFTQVSRDVAGVNVMFCSENCCKKMAEANVKDRVELVFGDKAFARGFEIRAKK